MYVDEKIALMDRMRRQKLQEDEKTDGKERPPEKALTLEDALAGLDLGTMRLQDGSLLEFDLFQCPVQDISFEVFKNFYDAKQENDEGLILLKRSKEISQMFSWPKADIAPSTFEQWGNLLVNGMAANRIYAVVKKKKQLTHVEYICYETPSGKGPVYNIIFRFREKRYGVVGNYNCMSADRETYGTILEAMVVFLDRWVDRRIRKEQDTDDRED